MSMFGLKLLLANLFRLSDVLEDFMFLLGLTFGAALSFDSVLATVVLSKMQQVSAIGLASVVVMAPDPSCHRSVPLLFTSSSAIMVAPAAVVGYVAVRARWLFVCVRCIDGLDAHHSLLLCRLSVFLLFLYDEPHFAVLAR